jgi:hypothetical protein
VPPDRELGEDRDRRDECDEPLEQGHRDDQDAPQQPAEAPDVLSDPGRGALRGDNCHQDGHDAEGRQDEAEQVAGVVHPRGRRVDDLHAVGACVGLCGLVHAATTRPGVGVSAIGRVYRRMSRRLGRLGSGDGTPERRIIAAHQQRDPYGLRHREGRA